MSNKKITSIGGQAVIEGVMMRGPFKTAVSVRKPNGEITMKLTENKVKGGFRKIPILRGIFGFVNSMVIGVNALMYSAQFYDDDGTPKEDVENKNGKATKNAENDKREDKVTKDDSTSNNKKEDNSSELSGFALFLTLLTSIALSVGLFFVLPNLIASLIVPNNNEIAIVSGDNLSGDVLATNKKAISGEFALTNSEYISGELVDSKSGDIALASVSSNSKRNDTLYNVVESIVKIAIFLGYLTLVSKMKDVRRVFEYHGAEHKTIFCYENGDELTVENVKKYKRFHPRCGTSFLLFVVIISIIVYSIVGRHPNLFMNVLIRIALLPLIAGVAYEIIRFAGKHTENKCIAWLSKPGMWLQRLTTREPDDSQIEVAINSLKAVIPEDEKADLW